MFVYEHQNIMQSTADALYLTFKTFKKEKILNIPSHKTMKNWLGSCGDLINAENIKFLLLD